MKNFFLSIVNQYTEKTFIGTTEKKNTADGSIGCLQNQFRLETTYTSILHKNYPLDLAIFSRYTIPNFILLQKFYLALLPSNLVMKFENLLYIKNYDFLFLSLRTFYFVEITKNITKMKRRQGVVLCGHFVYSQQHSL